MISQEKKLTIKYASALIIIALLSTLSFYVLYKSLQESSSTAYIVNLSGKQRMLSQHIALDVHRIHSSFHGYANTMHTVDFMKQRLLTYSNEMKEANKILSTGALPNGQYIALSAKVYDIYFGELKLKERVDEYVKISSELDNLDSKVAIDNMLIKIDTRSEQLLIDLNKVVKQYELEGVEKLMNLKILEIIAWILVLFILLLEVIFIFQPTVKKVISLLEENQHVLENLETEVELRTLKLQKANDSLKKLVSIDPMTGLKNRLTLEDDVEKAIEHFKNHAAPFSLLMFDIDWFKDVNDRYGHDVGDSVIKEVANILTASVREEDKVYRAGGEEFVILLNRISLEGSKKIAEKIRLLIEKKAFYADDVEFHKTISGGLYHSVTYAPRNIANVLKTVDNALYKSKKEGRNRVTEVS